MTAPVVTFYSYKGGVGRTQALANVAVRLANAGKRVIVVDMDLESPGVHAFFSPPGEELRNFQERDFANRPGVLDYLERCTTLPDEEPSIDGMLVACSHRFLRREVGSIHLLSPGRLDETYVERLAAFSWERFYSDQHGYSFVELMRKQLCEQADIVLVDSRTGLTDAGMVCTFQLPNLVVVPFALHRQGIDGAERIAKAIAHRHEGEPGAERARQILLVPSRVDDAAELERAEQFLNEARTHLAPIAHCELLDGHRDRIPYLAWFAYGENIVDPQADNRLSDAYERLTERIERALDLGTQSLPAPKAAEDAPLFAMIERESAQLRNDARDLARGVRASWDPQEPLERLARHASDILYKQAEIGRRIGALRDQIGHLETAADGNLIFIRIAVPNSLAGWEVFADSVVDVASEAKAQFLAHAKQRIRDAAGGDGGVLDTLWPDAEKSLAAATGLELRSRLVSLETRARRSTLDALLQRGDLDHATLAARYRTAKGRALWLDQRIQRFMDQADPSAESAAELANLLRLRVAERRDVPLVPNHWSAYDVLCLLVGEQKDPSEAAFKDIGLALWSDAWSAFFEGGSTSAFAAAEVECQRQLDRISSVDALVAPLVDTIAARIRGLWGADAVSQERLWRLFSDRRTDPCLQAAMARLAEDEGTGTDLHAAWLMDQAPVAAPAFRKPLRRVLEHLASNGRVGEAYYGLLTVGAQDPSILEDRSFFFTHTMLVEAQLKRSDSAEVVQRYLYDGAFSDRLAATPHGVALLAILACGLEGCARDPAVRSAARAALRQSLTIDLPQELDMVVSRPEFENPAYAGATMKVEDLLSRIREAGDRPVHATWHLHVYYETELKKLFAEDLDRIRGLPVEAAESLSLSISADDWIDVAAGIVNRDHQGDPPVGPAKDKIRQIFDTANELLALLTATVAPLSVRGRTIGQMEADAERVRDACGAITTWLGTSGCPVWLSQRIRNIWEAAS